MKTNNNIPNDRIKELDFLKWQQIRSEQAIILVIVLAVLSLSYPQNKHSENVNIWDMEL